MSTQSLLDRPTYTYSEVDRLVALPSGTARRWINGYVRGGKEYPPILRAERASTDWVTWGEFVETRMLAEFREDVPIVRLRQAVASLRQHFGLSYPLAHARPYLGVDGRELTIDLTALLPGEEGRAVARTGQRILEAASPVFHSATLAYDSAGEAFAAELPADIEYPGIRVNPDRLGGQPTFEGRRLAVATIAGLVQAGDPLTDIAVDYSLSLDQVDAAVRYAAKHKISA